MPMILREKRRSLHIGTNGARLSELTKEALSRPRSWYLPNTNVELDPYTSVRKIFYEFPKKAFYGETTTQDDVSSINNGSLTKVLTKENKPNLTTENIRIQNLRNSFTRLDIAVRPPSPVPSVMSTKSIDTNNNTVSPPKSKNMLNLSYFSSRASDTATLKEESSTYADFYCPNAKPPTSNFLRRSKRRSFDPSKYKDPIQRLDDEISMSSAGNVSSPHKRSFVYIDDLSNQVVDPQPMIERFLRDANKDICAGIYPPVEDSISGHSDPICKPDTKVEETGVSFIPWEKRITFIEATVSIPEQNFTNRRSNKRFGSLRRQKSFTLEKKQKPPPLRRAHTTLDNDTLASRRSSRTSLPSLKRNSSERNSKKRNMASTSTLNKQDYYSLPRDVPKAIRQRRNSSRMAARYFFQGYQDKLREEVFSIDFPSAYDPTSDPSSDEYITLSKEFNAKLLGKTYEQLLYIRSRLSESSRKTKFQCDGCFGCESELHRITEPQWV